MSKEEKMRDSYIYEVTRRLPKGQRREVAMELRELIGDMAETQEMKAVLEKLGDPAKLAAGYRDDRKCVIGPAYYEDYLWILKLVTGAVALSAAVSAGAAYFFQERELLAALGEFFSVLIGGILGGIGAVTLLFAVLERQKIRLDLKRQREWHTDRLGNRVWSIEQLVPAPEEPGRIDRGDTVVTLVFTLLFVLLLAIVPEWFGAYVFEDGRFVRTIPVFHLEQWGMLLPVFVLSLGIGFAGEVIRLAIGRYNWPVVGVTAVSGALQMVLNVILLRHLPLWNPDFGREMQAAFGEGVSPWAFRLDWIGSLILFVMFLAVLLEIGTAVYKTIRYGAG